jgi:hypothetical protein
MSVIEERDVTSLSLTEGLPAPARPLPPPAPATPALDPTTPDITLRTPWLGWIVPAAMLSLLLVLSPSLAHGEFVGLAAALGLSLAFRVGPTVLRAHLWARRPPAGGALQAASSSSWLLIGLAVLLAPVLAVAVGLPVLAAAILGIQAWPAAIVLSAERSDRMGRGCCGEVVRSVLVEAGLLLVLGMLLGALIGPTGVAIAMVMASVGGGVELYRAEPTCPSPDRLVVDRGAAYGVAVLALIAVSAQLDLLAAPEALGVTQADALAVAALAGKAIFVALIAVGSSVLVTAAAENGPVMRSIGRVFLLGAGLTALAVVSAPVIGVALDRAAPSPEGVLVPAVAMTFAACNWVAALALLVRRARGLVIPLTSLLAFGSLLLLAPPPVLSLEAAMALAQAAGFLVALFMLRRTRVQADVDLATYERDPTGTHDQAVVDLSAPLASSTSTSAAR